MLPRFIFLAIVVLALSACSRFGQLEDDLVEQTLWAEQQSMAAAVTQWNLYARGALRLEGEAYTIGIRWQRYDDSRFTMLIEAPFGQGVLRIETIAAGQYRLRLPNGQTYENTTVEALLDDAVGWSLPISGLDYWVRGLAHPETTYSHRLDSVGRAKSIRQDGWDIDYVEYFEVVSEPELPRRISLTNQTVTLKLVIERWQQMPTKASDADLFPSFN